MKRSLVSGKSGLGLKHIKNQVSSDLHFECEWLWYSISWPDRTWQCKADWWTCILSIQILPGKGTDKWCTRDEWITIGLLGQAIIVLRYPSWLFLAWGKCKL